MVDFVDVPQVLKRISRLYTLYQEGKIPTLAQHEVNPGHSKDSRENYLYFTLPPCLNFQRSSPAMWESALQTYTDTATRYLFYPEEVVKKSREDIQNDLVKHKLALQKNKHTDIWIAISKTLYSFYDSDPRKLFSSADWDVLKIHQIIQLDRKSDFPYLSGPKMANYWLYILSRYTDAEFKNMHEISIIPDTHVLQSTVKLGLSDISVTPIEAARIWKEVLVHSNITPIQMHPVLWNWSRNDFKPEV